MTPTLKKPRPYWHVDAKWISGICLLLLLSFTSLVFIAWQVTDRPTGTTLLTTLLASSFSYQNGGLDADSDIKIMRAMIANAPNKEWQPSPGMQIIVHEADITGKTPREVRMWFFRHLAEPLYDEGAQGLASLITDPELKKGVEENAKPLSFISAEMHSKLRGVLVASVVASLVFLGLLVFFSYRFGRIGSPGWVIILVGVPGLLFWGALRGGLTQLAQNPPAAAQQEAVKYYTQQAVDVLPIIVQKAVQVYTFLNLLGLGLLVIALIGTLFVRERKNRQDEVEAGKSASTGLTDSGVE